MRPLTHYAGDNSNSRSTLRKSQSSNHVDRKDAHKDKDKDRTNHRGHAAGQPSGHPDRSLHRLGTLNGLAVGGLDVTAVGLRAVMPCDSFKESPTLNSAVPKTPKADTHMKKGPIIYPSKPDNYELLEDCGRGVSATVYKAKCKTHGTLIAVKKCNLDRMEHELNEIMREATTLRQYHHPCVLNLHCSFVDNHYLWLVMPYMEGGSMYHIMNYCHPQGLEETLIATLMKDVLEGLAYVHQQKGIHRDVKAGNILLDMDGTVKLADFGVSATMERSNSWGTNVEKRNTLVGSPCWMAPEVLQGEAYNSSADIWSFGITLLELAHGEAPFAKLPPMRVLMLTLQNPPPTLDESPGRRQFSKAMKELVASCLNKDPAKRPAAAELLKHRFFQKARDKRYVVKALLEGLPPLSERVREIRTGENDVENSRRRRASMAHYVEEVTDWNFDIVPIQQQIASLPSLVRSETEGSSAFAPGTTRMSEASLNELDAGDVEAGSRSLNASRNSLRDRFPVETSPSDNRSSLTGTKAISDSGMLPTTVRDTSTSQTCPSNPSNPQQVPAAMDKGMRGRFHVYESYGETTCESASPTVSLLMGVNGNTVTSPNSATDSPSTVPVSTKTTSIGQRGRFQVREEIVVSSTTSSPST